MLRCLGSTSLCFLRIPKPTVWYNSSGLAQVREELVWAFESAASQDEKKRPKGPLFQATQTNLIKLEATMQAEICKIFPIGFGGIGVRDGWYTLGDFFKSLFWRISKICMNYMIRTIWMVDGVMIDGTVINANHVLNCKYSPSEEPECDTASQDITLTHNKSSASSPGKKQIY